jgi:hypothetical protein
MDEGFQTALQSSLFTSVPGLEDLVSGPTGCHKQCRAIPRFPKEPLVAVATIFKHLISVGSRIIFPKWDLVPVFLI